MSDDQKFSVSNNLIFRGLIIAMFALILALSGVVGNQFLSHMDSIDKSVDSLRSDYGTLADRVIRLEDHDHLNQ